MAAKFTPPVTCPHCGGTMKEGVLMPKRETASWGGHKGSFIQNNVWVETWWEVGYLESSTFGIKSSGRALVCTEAPYLVLHYRCVDCGYLESYAPEAVGEPKSLNGY